MTNNGSRSWVAAEWRGDERELVKNGGSVAGASLVDQTGKKKYLVLRDTNKGCICTTGILKAGEALKGLDAGQETTMFAKFPAPPASVTKLTVSGPHVPALDGGPLGS